ncbi:acetyltransferase domain-containing protein [Trichoderma sp. SZMC 28014]
MAQTNGFSAPLEWVTVKTTLPKAYPPMSAREPIRSERLVLRPFAATDVHEFHLLRLQPEVMKWTGQGRPDKDLEETAECLKDRLPGSAKGETAFEFAICLAETGEMIGTGGSHMRVGELGWPVIGYLLRTEFWGKGFATELNTAFLKAYWALPREEVEIKVEKSTIVGSETDLQPEHLTAITATDNGASQHVLGKLGFKLARLFGDEDPHSPGVMEPLHGYALQKPQV